MGCRVFNREIQNKTYFWPKINILEGNVVNWHCGEQNHHIEVAQGDIFMELKMRFGLLLGRLANGNTEKKLGADCE